ncbi:hypothetical protein BD779DRAFT_249554 [Infundibulicybe gibba]|nr:hypothetical protein BD779DRAFT_249554 [Infundibulicybe gibba]
MMMPTKAPAYPSPLVRRAVFRLPPEVLGEIFLHCLPLRKWGSFSACDAPWLLTKVCRSWREVVLSTPLLWSGLPFLGPGKGYWEGGGRLRLLELHLEHSAGATLSLALELPPNPDDVPFIPLITPHLSRVQHLSTYYHHELPGQKGYIAFKHFPRLKSLELLCSSFQWAPQSRSVTVGLGGIEFPWAQLTRLTINNISSSTEALALLRDCSSLEVCYLTPSDHSRTETPPAPSAPKTIHPHLRTLLNSPGIIPGPSFYPARTFYT